jgi:hypothetical protein
MALLPTSYCMCGSGSGLGGVMLGRVQPSAPGRRPAWHPPPHRSCSPRAGSPGRAHKDVRRGVVMRHAFGVISTCFENAPGGGSERQPFPRGWWMLDGWMHLRTHRKDRGRVPERHGGLTMRSRAVSGTGQCRERSSRAYAAWHLLGNWRRASEARPHYQINVG